MGLWDTLKGVNQEKRLELEPRFKDRRLAWTAEDRPDQSDEMPLRLRFDEEGQKKWRRQHPVKGASQQA
jgi:hypothetical protein